MNLRKTVLSPALFGVVLDAAVKLAGITGIGLALALGKFLLATLIALVLLGMFLRFKRSGSLRAWPRGVRGGKMR